MFEKRKILIADDEPGIIQLLKDYFEMQGYQVIEAVNGLEVLGKLSQGPDIILLDVNMPMPILCIKYSGLPYTRNAPLTFTYHSL